MNTKLPARMRRVWLVAGVIACAIVGLAAGRAPAQTPEFRAYWVDAWHAGFKTAAQCDQLIADTKAGNCNVVVIQVRRRGDTYYPSPYEPFASDADPNFDVLQYMIDQCHAQTPRIQVYAWLVYIPVWNNQTLPANPDHPVNKYPQFLSKNSSGATWDGGNYQFDPGHPDCEQYLNDIVIDIVNRYDVDGINYDYSRFSGSAWGYNDESVRRFNARYGRTGMPASTDSLWSQWRRDQMTNLIRKTYVNAIAIKPNIAMTSAVVTWHPSPAEAGDSFSGTRPYYDVFQDWQGWMREGILDISMPMAYFDRDGSYASDYDDWMNFAKDAQYNRATAIGPGIYMNDIADSIYQIRQARDFFNGRRALGTVMYSYATTNNEGAANSVFYNALSHPSAYDPNPTPVFDTPVEVPTLSWKTNPTKGHLRGSVTDCGPVRVDGATISITGPENRTMRTDGTGFYAFIDLAPGTYSVSASYPGETTQTKTATIAAGLVSNLDFGFCPAPPVISNVRSENVGLTTADIKWDTDQLADSQVEYGLTVSYGSMSPLDIGLVSGHVVTLANLLPGRTYHYRVHTANSQGAEAVSGDYTFTTVPDTTPPVISNVTVASVGATEATITWATDDAATGQVEYGRALPYDQATAEDIGLVISHTVRITGLTPEATYHFRVKSTNASSLTSYSEDGSFTTRRVTEVIVDDLQATFTETAPDYLWSSGAYPGGWPVESSQYRYVWNIKGSVTATCTWTPNLPYSGPYDVYVWYPSGANRTTAARYIITHGGVVEPYVAVNQQQTGSQWVRIGEALNFDAGTGGNVKLNNRTTETSKTKAVIADAVKFVYVGGDTVPPSVPQNAQAAAVSTSQIALTWSPSTDDTGVIGYNVYRDGALLGSTVLASYNDSGLSTNTQYTYSVSARDAAANESAQSKPVSRYTLSHPPTAEDITCDKSSGTWHNTPTFTFSNGGFGTGKVSYYRYAWDNSPTHTWTDTETSWLTGTIPVNATTTSQPWYFHVRGYNGDGAPNGSVDLGLYYHDSDAPTISRVTCPRYLGIRGTSCDDLSADWLGADSASGVAEYMYAIGASPGATDILNWTSAGTGTSGTYHYPDAPLHDYGYYWTVKAKDHAGNWSSALTSNASVYANAYATLAAAMANPDTTPVMVDNEKVVSANLGSFFYVQEPDRTRGLRVNLDSELLPGRLAAVAGRLSTVDGERQLDSVEASSSGGGKAPYPLGIGIPAIGGVSPDAYTPGFGYGCYNLGLLVRIYGRVVEKGGGYFVLSDGSKSADGSPVSVKVYSSASVGNASFVGVSGIAAIESGVRVIRTRGAEDVRIYVP